jgi:hypothetical protein
MEQIWVLCGSLELRCFGAWAVIFCQSYTFVRPSRGCELSHTGWCDLSRFVDEPPWVWPWVMSHHGQT